jgi:hypothetical protein
MNVIRRSERGEPWLAELIDNKEDSSKNSQISKLRMMFFGVKTQL